MNVGEFELSSDFDVYSLNIFDNILDENSCKGLSEKIISLMEISSINVNDDGINMLTLNGDFLTSKIPEISLIHDQILQKLKLKVPKLMPLADTKVGISTNLLMSNRHHTFRPHFDRHEFTAVIYLSKNDDYPIKVFPNIRTDPRFTEGTWLYDSKEKNPNSIFPTPGRMIVFKGRTTLHGVEFIGGEKSSIERVSIQFGFDTNFKTFENQKYYGNLL
jgi:hypothetical protein